MKFRMVGLLLVSIMVFSCSSDKDESNNSNTSIIGTWDATELVVDLDTASDDAIFGSQILQVLTKEDCYIISLTFNQDLTAVASSAVNNLEVNVGSSGLSVPCPTDFDSEANTYTFEDGVVSFLNEDGEMVNASVSISGDIMTVNAASLEIPNFDESGDLIFRRR